ncbi:transposase [Cellulosilyticum ruminicola]|uniref:transposase n=1 Tax=Cellulosilyticum ruminicola TaxID=425254 RepID=UPI0009F9B504
MNRSIQAEESFANIKGDMSFRRYLCRGQKNMLAESILLTMAHNLSHQLLSVFCSSLFTDITLI